MKISIRGMYSDLARELKSCNIKVTVIAISISTLSTVTKELIQGMNDIEIRGQVETI